MKWYKLHFKFSNGYCNISSFYHVFTMSSCVAHQPSYFTWIVPPSVFLSLLAGFERKVMQICGDIEGIGLWESFQGLLARHQA
jgi:hypothetical protein